MYKWTDGTTYLMHHGIKGQKWGQRNYQYEDGTLTPEGRQRYLVNPQNRINKMYDRMNERASKKATKYDQKGKVAKAAILREMVKRNNKDRKNKTDALNKMRTKSEIDEARKTGLINNALGRDKLSDPSLVNMTNVFSRVNERTIQMGMRYALMTTSEKYLSTMSPEKGYEYIRTKALTSRAHSSGYNAGRSASK